MRAAMRIDLGPARLVSGRPGGLGGRASLRGRAGPALAGGFERRWAGSTDIFKVLSNLFLYSDITLRPPPTRPAVWEAFVGGVRGFRWPGPGASFCIETDEKKSGSPALPLGPY
jgi:hypothetical protein